MAHPLPLRPAEWLGSPAGAAAPTATTGRPAGHLSPCPHDGRAAPLLPPAPDAPHERSATRSRRMLVAGGVLIVVVLIVAAVVLASETGVGKPVNARTLDSGPYSVRFLAVRGQFCLFVCLRVCVRVGAAVLLSWQWAELVYCCNCEAADCRALRGLHSQLWAALCCLWPAAAAVLPGWRAALACAWQLRLQHNNLQVAVEADPSSSARLAFGTPALPQVGDWGRGPGQKEHDNQTAVAQLMDRVAAAQPVEFIVSTGDNFYPNGLTSYKDPAFTDTFTKTYSAKSLQVRRFWFGPVRLGACCGRDGEGSMCWVGG